MGKHGGSNKEIAKDNKSKSHNENEVGNTNDTDDDTASREEVSKQEEYHVEEWVSVKIDKDWFIGKIIEIDREEGYCKITFMRQTKCKDASQDTFKWPVPVDELWSKFGNIICKISPPFAMGRIGGSYTISQECLDKIMAAI